MSDSPTAAGSETLRFDRVIVDSGSTTDQANGVACSRCDATIPTEYYSINGTVVCERCRNLIEHFAETPQNLGTFLVAALFGLGAGIAGAVIYFAVLYVAHLEIGIVAILIGYMVGYSVRKGAGGRGGLRFQVLAVALTYGSVALAYAPVVVIEAVRSARAAQQTGGAARQSATPPSRSESGVRPRPGFLGLGVLLMFIVALPILVIWSSLPFGVISGFIIFIGMRQAWRMTGPPRLEIYGPYQVSSQSLTQSV